MADPDPAPDDAAPVLDVRGGPRVVATASQIAREVGLAVAVAEEDGAAAAPSEAAPQVS